MSLVKTTAAAAQRDMGHELNLPYRRQASCRLGKLLRFAVTLLDFAHEKYEKCKNKIMPYSKFPV